MKTASRKRTYDAHGPYNKPQMTVSPGEEFLAETELNTGGWLHSLDDCWTPDKTSACNPSVCIAVEGAVPGDLLAVDILDIAPEDIGFTGFDVGFNPLAGRVIARDWGVSAKTVKISREGIHWSDSLTLPLRPMIGTLGTAPAEEIVRNTKNGTHGGNLDIQEVCTGSTVYLPVEVHGALLHVGDVHALQGDGEINGAGGIECRAVVRLRTRLLERPEGFHCIRIESDEYIMTVGSEKTLEESFYKAVEQLLRWMEADYNIPVSEGYLLLGQVLEARNTQFVNPTNSYLCKVRKCFVLP